MKYEIGDLVSKPVTGICKIEDILYLNLLDEKNNKFLNNNYETNLQTLKKLIMEDN